MKKKSEVYQNENKMIYVVLIYIVYIYNDIYSLSVFRNQPN